jgi:hypothetical protein
VKRKLSILLVTVGIMLAGIGCGAPAAKSHRMITMDKNVALGRAESTQVSIGIGIGNLSVTGGAEGALEARFDYETPEWKPEVTYDVEQGLGRLAVRQPDSKVAANSDVRYDWNLKLAGKVPTNLVIETGVGKVELDTRGLNLRHLKVSDGVGEGRLDLSYVRSDLTVEVEAAIGKLQLLLPTDIGVEVKADGIGRVVAAELNRGDSTWTNAAWGKTKASISVDISGMGEVDIETMPRQTI